MKKLMCMILVVAMLLTSFAACGSPDDQGNQTEAGAKVGDVLQQPEKTVSLEDVMELTITANFSAPKGGMEREMVHVVSGVGGITRFYEKTFAQFSNDQPPVYMERICVVDQDAALAYYRFDSTSDYMPIELGKEFGSDDGYFRSNLAFIGVEYQNWLTTDGFVKKEDSTCLGKNCFVYETTYTMKLQPEEKIKAVIWVDKETGLWLKSDETAVATGYTITRSVASVQTGAAVFPGTPPVDMKEQVIYNENDIVITAKALDFSDPNGTVLRLETRNNSASDVRIASHYFDINGLCMGGSILSYSCAAGKTEETALKLSGSAIELSGIEMIQSIEMALKIENVHTESSPDGSYTKVDGVVTDRTDAITIQTECPGDYVQPVNKNGTILIDTDAIYLVLSGAEIEKDGSGFLKAYCENRLAEPIRATIDIKTINGIEYDDFDKFAMQENSEGFDGFWLDSDFLKENGIQRIESIELTHEVFSGESFVGSQRVTEESELIRIDFTN